VPGLSFINKLQPITYNLDLDAADKITQNPQLKDKDGKTIQPSADKIAARQVKEKLFTQVLLHRMLKKQQKV